MWYKQQPPVKLILPVPVVAPALTKLPPMETVLPPSSNLHTLLPIIKSLEIVSAALLFKVTVNEEGPVVKKALDANCEFCIIIK